MRSCSVHSVLGWHLVRRYWCWPSARLWFGPLEAFADHTGRLHRQSRHLASIATPHKKMAEREARPKLIVVDATQGLTKVTTSL